MKMLPLMLMCTIFSACTYHDMQPIETKSAPVSGNRSPMSDSSWTSSFDPGTLSVSYAFDPGLIVGTIDDPSLDEISGLAASKFVSNSLWVEEDSGNPNAISLVSSSGKLIGDVSIEHVANRDWEDMSISTGPTEGVRYIYLADIGDNHSQYEKKYVYRFPEPAFTGSASPFHNSISAFDIISFSFPDGIKNSESVMIDPLTKDIYVISKESDKAVVYVARYPQPLGNNFVIEKIGTLPIAKATAADISSDGTEILIKNYTQVFYWQRSADESISVALRRTPLLLRYTIEPQGESICFASDGSGFYTTSEKVDVTPPAIYFYKRK